MSKKHPNELNFNIYLTQPVKCILKDIPLPIKLLFIQTLETQNISYDIHSIDS